MVGKLSWAHLLCSLVSARLCPGGCSPPLSNTQPLIATKPEGWDPHPAPRPQSDPQTPPRPGPDPPLSPQLWIMPAFGARPHFSNTVEVDFYGYSLWAAIVNICLPFGIFYRMHAVSSLLEVYVMS